MIQIVTRLGREVDVNDDYTVDQNWEQFTQQEHDRWDRLYERQSRLLPGRACEEYLEGLKLLSLSKSGIPNFDKLSDDLEKLTGWRVVAVPDLVPDDVFFDHLANKRFPAGNFIRSEENLDYLQEPDVFHDVFGHVPMLTNPVFSDYMQAYGKGGQRADGMGVLKNLARLYWYTVEFGLINTPEGMRIYGAGIVSSKSESIYCLESPSPNRLHFDLERLMKTDYIIDDFQQTYWVISSFEELLEATYQDFGKLYEKLANSTEIHSVDTVLPSDKTYTHGDQSYARAGGRKKA